MVVRVLIAGAAGFLGLASVRAFVAAGHEVRGLVRTREQIPRIRATGGIPVLGDLLDPSSLGAAVHGVELVVHLAQLADGTVSERRSVRVDGGRNLLEASSGAGVRRFVVGSGYWVYADNPGVVSEESPIAPRSISRVNYETEELVRSAVGPAALDWLIVRPGMVYGDGSWFAAMAAELRARTYHYIEPGSNYLSPISLPDAASAIATISIRSPPSETYLVVDDSPVTTREFAEFVADQMGFKPPTAIPLEEAERAWGTDLAALNAASRRGSNSKLRGLGWAPKDPSFRTGVPRVLASLGKAEEPAA